MFYISANYGDGRYGVTDTADNVTETYTMEELDKYVKAGVEIRGLAADGGVFCRSLSLVKDYVDAVVLMPGQLKEKYPELNKAQLTAKVCIAAVKLAVNIGLCIDVKDFLFSWNFRKYFEWPDKPVEIQFEVLHQGIVYHYTAGDVEIGTEMSWKR